MREDNSGFGRRVDRRPCASRLLGDRDGEADILDLGHAELEQIQKEPERPSVPGGVADAVIFAPVPDRCDVDRGLAGGDVDLQRRPRIFRNRSGPGILGHVELRSSFYALGDEIEDLGHASQLDRASNGQLASRRLGAHVHVDEERQVSLDPLVERLPFVIGETLRIVIGNQGVADGQPGELVVAVRLLAPDEIVGEAFIDITGARRALEVLDQRLLEDERTDEQVVGVPERLQVQRNPTKLLVFARLDWSVADLPDKGAAWSLEDESSPPSSASPG